MCNFLFHFVLQSKPFGYVMCFRACCILRPSRRSVQFLPVFLSYCSNLLFRKMGCFPDWNVEHGMLHLPTSLRCSTALCREIPMGCRDTWHAAAKEPQEISWAMLRLYNTVIGPVSLFFGILWGNRLFWWGIGGGGRGCCKRDAGVDHAAGQAPNVRHPSRIGGFSCSIL